MVTHRFRSRRRLQWLGDLPVSTMSIQRHLADDRDFVHGAEHDGQTAIAFVMTPMMADSWGPVEVRRSVVPEGDTVYGFGSTAGSVYNFAANTSAPELTIYDAGGTER